MKKQRKKLSLKKFNIARLSKNMHLIYGGSTNTQNHTTHSDINQTCGPDTEPPPANSSLECLEAITDDCPTRGVICVSQ